MIELFLFNTWAIVIFSIVLLINLCLVANEKFSSALGVTVLFLGGIWFFNQNPFSWIWHNPDKAFYIALVYGVLGFFYSMFKYKSFLKNAKKELGFTAADHTPNNHKADIIGWIFWWPLSLVGYLVFDFIAELGDKIFSVVRGAFERIYKKVIDS